MKPANQDEIIIDTTQAIKEKDRNNPAKPGKKENLKQRAYLNSVASILDVGANQIAGFIANPFIVSGLGSTFFGVWKMLGQMTGYAGLADTRATQVLKWSIAKNRDIAADEELKSYVTTTFVLIALILPIILIAGGIISWYSPQITGISPDYYTVVRIACAILMLNLVIRKVFDIFGNTLRGMNLSYKRMGIQSAVVLIGAALKIAAIQLGYGLIGLSVAQVIITGITGLVLYAIVKKHIGWFGFGKTNFAKVINFGKLSGWFMAFTGVKMALSSDILILGIIAGPALVTSYSITKYISNAIAGVISNAVYGIIPGLGGAIGKKKFKTVRIAREQLMILTWLLGTASGAIILIFNESFIGLWIGEQHFAGNIVNTLLVIMVLQNILISNDGAIINVTLNIRMKVLFSFLAALTIIILSIILIKPYGIIGLCISIIAGRSLLSFGFPYIVKKEINASSKFSINTKIRPLLVSVIIFGASKLIAENIIIDNWIHLIILIPPALLTATLFCWLLGLRSQQKNALKGYFNKIKIFKND